MGNGAVWHARRRAKAKKKAISKKDIAQKLY